jgi:hypothetical protein
MTVIYILLAVICCCALAQLPPKRGGSAFDSSSPAEAREPFRFDIRCLPGSRGTCLHRGFGGSGAPRYPPEIVLVSIWILVCCMPLAACVVAVHQYHTRNARLRAACASLVDQNESAADRDAPEQPRIDDIGRWSGIGTFAEQSGAHQSTTIELKFRQTPLPAAPAVAAVAGVGSDLYGAFKCSGVASTCSAGRKVAIAMRKTYTDGAGLSAQCASSSELEYYGMLNANCFEGKWLYIGSEGASGSFRIAEASMTNATASACSVAETPTPTSLGH